MTPFRKSLLLCFLFVQQGMLYAQERPPRLPPEERRAMRQQMREHWEQNEGHRPEFHHDEERGARWQPDERRRLRDDMRGQGPPGGEGGGFQRRPPR